MAVLPGQEAPRPRHRCLQEDDPWRFPGHLQHKLEAILPGPDAAPGQGNPVSGALHAEVRCGPPRGPEAAAEPDGRAGGYPLRLPGQDGKHEGCSPARAAGEDEGGGRAEQGHGGADEELFREYRGHHAA